MKKDQRARQSEDGIALLIAIFVLLLISVVAIALLVSSGTETALGANYRSSSTVYYAALAGLEEARGRLLPKNPTYFGASVISPSVPFPLGQTLYILNRLPSETVAPWDPANPYYDSEYATEFGTEASASSWQALTSVWDNSPGGVPGPAYKWVRINAVTEQSIYIDVNAGGGFNTILPLYFDVANIDLNGNPNPSLVRTSSPPTTASQALEITSFAALPSGSKKYLQYLVAPAVANITFPAALTLNGSGDVYPGTTHPELAIRGDSDIGDPACGAPTTPYPVPGIGVPDLNPDVPSIKSTIPAGLVGNYTGTGGSPSVAQVLPASYLQSPKYLDAIVQFIIQNADVRISGPADQTQIPAAMSAANPMTIAVVGDQTVPGQGDFNLSGFTGYGLLLVTGNFTYTPDSGWNGIVLVVGQGNVSSTAAGSGGAFNGAMLVAQTRNPAGNVQAAFGPASFNVQYGNNLYYKCGWIKTAEAPMTYKILSFHEIPQP